MKLILTILLFISFNAFGQTNYYVTKAGNDGTGTGTIGNPWLTIYKATSTASTVGDTIHIGAGTYLETSTLVIVPGVNIMGVEGDSTAVVIRSTNTALNVPIMELNSAEGTATPAQFVRWLTFDGQLATSMLIACFGRSNMEFGHLQGFDAVLRGIVISAKAGFSNDSEPVSYSLNNTVHHCWLRSNSAHQSFGTGEINIGGQKDMRIHHNKLESLRPSGQNGWPIKYLTDGWYKNLEIDSNTLNKTPVAYTNATGGGSDWYFVIELSRSMGVNVHHNRMSGGGFDCNIGWKLPEYDYSLRVCDNIITQPSPNPFLNTAITFEFDHSHIIVERNYTENFGIGVGINPRHTTENGTLGGDVDSVWVRNNLFIVTIGESNSRGISFYSDANYLADAQYNISDVWIDNNTIIAKDGYAGTFGIVLPESDAGGVLNNWYIRNNIVSNFSEAAIVHNNSSMVVASNVTMQNNNFYGNGRSNAPYYPGVPPTPLTYTGNVSGTPSYGANYTIPAASGILYNTGVNVGLPVQYDTADIGYHEYGTPPLSLPPRLWAGVDASYDFPHSFNLAGTVTDEGTLVDTTWTITETAGGATIVNQSLLNTLVTDAAVGNHTFKLTATDNDANESTDYVTVSINPPNQYPTVSAGADQTITVSNTTVNASVTNFPGSVSRNHASRSENISSTVWKKAECSVLENRGLDLNGNMTLDEVNINIIGSGAYVRQEAIPALPNTTYYLSFDCYLGTAREVRYSVVAINPSITAIADRVAYTNQVDTISASRVSLQFTTPANTTSVWIMLDDLSSTPPFNGNGTFYVGRVQVTPINGDTYIKTGATAITANLPAANTVSYLWTKLSGSGTLSNAAIQSPSISDLTGTSVYRVLVTDDMGSKNQDEVQIIANPAAAPVRGWRINKRIIYNPN